MRLGYGVETAYPERSFSSIVKSWCSEDIFDAIGKPSEPVVLLTATDCSRNCVTCFHCD